MIGKLGSAGGIFLAVDLRPPHRSDWTPKVVRVQLAFCPVWR
jgi:hypothetical protein